MRDREDQVYDDVSDAIHNALMELFGNCRNEHIIEQKLLDSTAIRLAVSVVTEIFLTETHIEEEK